MVRRIVLEPHNPDWSDMFHDEAKQIRSILKYDVFAMYHIGSTTIPDIKAKPIIDILVEVHDIKKIKNHFDGMKRLGYKIKRSAGIPGREFFVKEENGIRTYHVHIFQIGNPHIQRHINFRDYLISHPKEANEYSHLKEKLAMKYETDTVAYTNGKEQFIRRIDKKAAEWIVAVRESPSFE